MNSFSDAINWVGESTRQHVNTYVTEVNILAHQSQHMYVQDLTHSGCLALDGIYTVNVVN